MEIAKKISVSLPQDLLASLDELVGKNRRRSKLIESALREYISREQIRQPNQREVDLLNANAEKLNEEALDVLEYQEVSW